MKKQNQVRPGLPPDARAEILEALGANMEIGSDEIVAILKRHHVSEDMGILQDRYRRQLGQRLMASLRDDDGRREVMSNGKGRYFVLECCRDQRQLQSVQRRIQNQMRGLDATAGKVRVRIRVLDRLKSVLMQGLDKAEELKELYERVASQYDPDGFRLYFAAQEIVGIKRLWEEYPYEDACGRFAEADGHELLKYLTAAYFEAVSWEIVPGTTYEKAILGKVDTSTPEYIAFEKRLYETVLERMGFREQLPRPSGRAQTDHATGKDNCKRGDAR